MIGLKILSAEMRSLNGHVTYSTEWQEIPGNGAYVAHTAGLWASGRHLEGAHYVAIECEGEVTPDEPPPAGVRCWRRVRIIGDASPEQIAKFVQAEPYDALTYAAKHLASIVPAEVWIEVGQR